jgi:K+-transporting ATPase ATPase B chain
MTKLAARPLFDPPIVRRAIRDAFGKLDPRRMSRNPVMFVVEVGSVFTTLLFLHALITGAGDAGAGFIAAISVWLWFTVLFANFAEAMAEGRGKAQADSLRKARRDVPAVVLDEPRRDAPRREKSSSQLRAGDIVLVEVGQIIPGDGEILEGVASVNENAITGESAPVIFNALIIIALIPLALRGIKVRPAPAPVVLRRNILVFGLGGLVLPFPFIKLIDVILSGLGLPS